MPRILPPMRPVRLARVLAFTLRPACRAACLALALAAGCGGDGSATQGAAGDGVRATPDPSADPEPGLAQPERADEARAHVETFVVSPDYVGLVGLLRQGHARARERLGPHRLRYTATFTTGPAGLDPAQPVPPVPVGEPIHERFVVTDELELVWASPGAQAGGPPEPPRLSLNQHNEHEHGRALILLDDRMWTALDGREWLARPVEADLWRLWADDAQHAVLDLVELAGPHAALGPVALDDLGGRPAVHVSLRQAEQHHPERVVEAPTPWRDRAQVRVIAATIVLDRATGLWRRASIELDWIFKDSAGRELSGHVQLEGSVEVLAAPPMIAPPADSKPVPERERPELLRERLLNGLAGP